MQPVFFSIRSTGSSISFSALVFDDAVILRYRRLKAIWIISLKQLLIKCCLKISTKYTYIEVNYSLRVILFLSTNSQIAIRLLNCGNCNSNSDRTNSVTRANPNNLTWTKWKIERSRICVLDDVRKTTTLIPRLQIPRSNIALLHFKLIRYRWRDTDNWDN